jgi:hypothetical protein
MRHRPRHALRERQIEMMEFLFEVVADGYRGGEKVTLDVGERDGSVVIGLTVVGDTAGGARACLLQPAVAESVVHALEEAISRANVKRAS